MSWSKRVWFGLLILVSIGLSGCGLVGSDPAPEELTHIRLPMGFVANVQFAPWYVAVERGYFAEEGFDLEFDYGWETDGVRLVGAGELPFAVASGDQILLARSQGLPVVTFVNWFQRFPVAVATLQDSGIESPADLEGRKVGIPATFGASYIGWRALASEFGMTDQDVELEVIGYTALVNLTEERVDASVVYANNEPVQLEHQGYDPLIFPVADYATLVSNGIISNEETLAEDPEMVQAFARAFLRGLEDTLANPDEAFEICKEYVEQLEENKEVQRAVFDATLLYWEGAVLGQSDPEAWANTAQVMRNAGLLEGEVEAERAFTNEFLP